MEFDVKGISEFVLKSAVVAAALAWSGIAAAQTYEIKAGTVTINETEHRIAELVVEELEKQSGGRIRGRVFPAGQLGSVARQIEGLQLGTQEFFVNPPTFMVGLNPAFQVLDAPGLFDDRAHAERAFLDPAFHDKYTKLAVNKGVECIGLFVYDFTAIASMMPIRRPEDLKGAKIRVLATKMESALMASYGAAGVPMDYMEVMNALQQRAIDGVRSTAIVMGGSKFFSVAKHITMEASSAMPACIKTSVVWLKSLPADLRALVYKVGRELEPRAHALGREYEAKVEQLWKDNGAEVIRYSPEDQAKMKATLRPIGEQFLGGNPQTREMYEILKQVAEKTRKS